MEHSSGETSTFCRPEVSASPCVWCTMYGANIDTQWNSRPPLRASRAHESLRVSAQHETYESSTRFLTIYKWLSLACSSPTCSRNETSMCKFGLHSIPTLIAIVICWWRNVSTFCYSTRKRSWIDIVNFLLVWLNTLVVVSENSRIKLNPVSQRDNSETFGHLVGRTPPWGYFSHLWL